MLEIRQGIHSEHAKTLGTQELRQAFLVEKIFQEGQLTMTYSHIDRIVFGGISPKKQALSFPESLGKQFGVSFFLERRELGLINIGGNGIVKVDGTSYEISTQEALYIGMGAKDIFFESVNSSNLAKFYYNCAPAHQSYPNKKITIEDAAPIHLGDPLNSNKRTIYKYIVPDVLPTCQLLMGLTKLAEGSLWNTMPCHLHERRMEVYFYFDMQPDAAVFHMMGEPHETRHIVIRNEQAVISPSWSLHSGVGTQNYTFIWGMVGENQTFDDMDHIAIKDLF